jgi:hypothetical protein
MSFQNGRLERVTALAGWWNQLRSTPKAAAEVLQPTHVMHRSTESGRGGAASHPRQAQVDVGRDIATPSRDHSISARLPIAMVFVACALSQVHWHSVERVGRVDALVMELAAGRNPAYSFAGSRGG